MKIVNTLADSLDPRTKSRIEKRVLGGPALPNSRVFLAKSGNRTVGTAVVEHENRAGNRQLVAYLDATSPKVEDQLVNRVKDSTKHLKRRLMFS